MLEIAVSVACYQTLANALADEQLLLLSRVLNGACIVYGIKILILVAIDTAECTRLNSTERGHAQKCIDIYENYAAIGSAESSPCASLNVQTETLLGGVCPTVYLGETTGAVVLSIEVAVAVIFLALNMSKYSMVSAYVASEKCRGPCLPHCGSEKNTKSTTESKTKERCGVSGGSLTLVAAPIPLRKPMTSIYTSAKNNF